MQVKDILNVYGKNAPHVRLLKTAASPKLVETVKDLIATNKVYR
jgi:hypothetical protein